MPRGAPGSGRRVLAGIFWGDLIYVLDQQSAERIALRRPERAGTRWVVDGTDFETAKANRILRVALATLAAGTVERDGNGYAALCPEVDVASQGDSVARAQGG